MRHGLLRPQGVDLAIGFGPQPVSILADLVQRELEFAAKMPEADTEGFACLYE